MTFHSEPSVRGWHTGRGLCWLPVLAVLPTTLPLQGRRGSGVPGSLCSAHGSGRDGNVHRAMITHSTGAKSKLCSAASTQTLPHPALLQAVTAPAMVPCPFCSEKPPAPGSPDADDADGLFPPHHCSPAPLACGGAPFPGGQAEKPQGTRCTSSKADDHSSVNPSSLLVISPLPTCTLSQQISSTLILCSKDLSLWL